MQIPVIILALFISTIAWKTPAGAQQLASDAPVLDGATAAVYGRQPVRVSAASNAVPIAGGESQPDTSPVTNNDGFPAFNASETLSSAGADESRGSSGGSISSPLVSVCSSLALVLGLFAVFVWVTRKYGSRSLASTKIPDEVLQSLGSTAIDPRTRISMLRVGGRILVVAQSATGIDLLSEITDSDEVARLIAACQGHATNEFAATLESIKQEPAPTGFVQPQSAPSRDVQPQRQRGRLFATA